jgi:NDP-sugar pyrophosphorylase family protein
VLHNVDVLSTIDLRRMAQFHDDSKALATLAVQKRESSRQLLFDQDERLSGRAIRGQKMEIVAPAAKLEPLAFSGVHIMSPRLLPKLTEEGVFSIIDAYLRLAAGGESIRAFRCDEFYWRDLGRLEDIRQALEDLKSEKLPASDSHPDKK